MADLKHSGLFFDKTPLSESRFAPGLRYFKWGSFNPLNDGRFDRPPVGAIIPSNNMFRKRRSSFRRRSGNGKRRKTSATTMARKALSISRKLQRKQEVKAFSHPLTTIASVANTGDIRSLALIAQGDLVSQRDGNKISPFFLKLRLNWLGLAADTVGIFRTIIFRDKDQIASNVPTVLDVLEENNALSQINLVSRHRWKILYDRTWTQSNVADLRLNYVDIIGLKLTLGMSFIGAANTGISENGLFMLNITNIAANLPSFTFTGRLFYNDN